MAYRVRHCELRSAVAIQTPKTYMLVIAHPGERDRRFRSIVTDDSGRT